MSKLRNQVMGSLERAFELALNRRSPKMVQHTVLNTIKRWEDARGDRYGLAVYIQPYLAKRFDRPLCGYCQFVVWPNEPHELCQHKLAGEVLCPFCNNWVPEGGTCCPSYNNLVHSVFLQYDDEEDWEDWEDEEEPTQVWFTEAPCGHCGYE